MSPPLRMSFAGVRDDGDGMRWSQLVLPRWEAYQPWFLHAAGMKRPGYLQCIRALREFMPEIVPIYEMLVDLAGGGDSVARFLSQFCPPPYMTGCSQLVRTVHGPQLMRNYDYDPKLCEGILLCSDWMGRRTIAMNDCLWGVLDGMNDAGLIVALSFGGRQIVGEGFGIPLILRYILETCELTSQAVDVLRRVPSHMAYNVTVVDRRGQFTTAYVAPDRPSVFVDRPFSVNHQQRVEWPRHAELTASVAREHALTELSRDKDLSREQVLERFLQTPLYSKQHRRGWGTLYTSAYESRNLKGSLLWQDQHWEFALDGFTEKNCDVTFA